MRFMVLSAFLSCAVLAGFVFPAVGVLAYNWFSFMNPHRLMWGGSAIPWAKLLAVAMLLMWFLSGERKKIPLPAPMVLLVLFFAWTAVTTFVGGPMFPATAQEELIDFGKMVVTTLLASAIMNSRDRLHAMVWILAISLGFWTVKGGLFVLLTVGKGTVLGPPFSEFPEANRMARVIVMAVPLMYYLFLHSKHRGVRLGLLCAAGTSVLALIGTHSRGGFLAFVAMCAFAWLFSRRKLGLMVLGVTVVLIGLTIIPEERLSGWTSRIETIETYEKDNSAQTRLMTWQWAMDLAQRRPIFGGGFGAFQANIHEGWKTSLDAHNNYFEVLGEHGYFGLMLYILMGCAALLLAQRVQMRTEMHPELYWARDLALVIQISMVGYFVGGLTANTAIFSLYYVLMGMLAATDALVTRELSAAALARRAAMAPARPVRPGARLRPSRAGGR